MIRTLTRKEFLKEWSGDTWRDGDYIYNLDYDDLEVNDDITLNGTDDAGWYRISFISSQNIDLVMIDVYEYCFYFKD